MTKRAGVGMALIGAALLGWGSTAMAADELAGVAAVRTKNTSTNSVQLGERTFKLDDDSMMRDADGVRIGLRDLDVPDLGRGGSDPMLGALVARYDAVLRGQTLILRTLDLEPSFE